MPAIREADIMSAERIVIGRLVAFDEFSLNTGLDIWTVDLVEGRTTTPYVQTEFNEQAPSFSPDGRWIAYQSDATGRDEIYIGPRFVMIDESADPLPPYLNLVLAWPSGTRS